MENLVPPPGPGELDQLDHASTALAHGSATPLVRLLGEMMCG